MRYRKMSKHICSDWKTTSFSLSSSHLPVLPERERGDPGTGWLVTCCFDNCEHQGLSNQAIFRIELCQILSITLQLQSPVIFKNNFRICSNVYPKEVCPDAVHCGSNVVAVLPAGYMESQSYFIFFICCSATK